MTKLWDTTNETCGHVQDSLQATSREAGIECMAIAMASDNKGMDKSSSSINAKRVGDNSKLEEDDQSKVQTVMKDLVQSIP